MKFCSLPVFVFSAPAMVLVSSEIGFSADAPMVSDRSVCPAGGCLPLHGLLKSFIPMGI